METAGEKGRKGQDFKNHLCYPLLHCFNFLSLSFTVAFNHEKWVSPAIRKNCVLPHLSSVPLVSIFCLTMLHCVEFPWPVRIPDSLVHRIPHSSQRHCSHWVAGFGKCPTECAAGVEGAVSRGWEALMDIFQFWSHLTLLLQTLPTRYILAFLMPHPALVCVPSPPTCVCVRGGRP